MNIRFLAPLFVLRIDLYSILGSRPDPKMETVGHPARLIFSNDFCDFLKHGPDRFPEAPGAPQGPPRDPPGDPQGTPRDYSGSFFHQFFETFFQ